MLFIRAVTVLNIPWSILALLGLCLDLSWSFYGLQPASNLSFQTDVGIFRTYGPNIQHPGATVKLPPVRVVLFYYKWSRLPFALLLSLGLHSPTDVPLSPYFFVTS